MCEIWSLHSTYFTTSQTSYQSTYMAEGYEGLVRSKYRKMGAQLQAADKVHMLKTSSQNDSRRPQRRTLPENS